MKTLPIKLDEALHLQLQLAASIAGIGRSEFVIQALRKAIAAQKKGKAA